LNIKKEFDPMQYTEGQLGRVFVVRIDDGEDMLVSLRQFILDKNIQSGSITFLGALMNGRMVTGPEEPVIPPVPHFVMFEGGWEVFGVGTIYPGESGPHIHYHASVGRSGHALTGCLREQAITYLIIEAVIMEFTGLKARREFDQKTQLHLPVLGERGGDAVKLTDFEKTVEKKEDARPIEKKEEKDDLPGGLAEIIRDLTRRPPQ
jgi:predicted DNA-binding protein with PD1-like motif